ncbi:hypothetical protein T484DRAFT_1964116 [Baffinella frigidus]|nr:hypothetical protein T484DRAFT_1964116 [Cryptophyta sp. CCMP2293]
MLRFMFLKFFQKSCRRESTVSKHKTATGGEVPPPLRAGERLCAGASRQREQGQQRDARASGEHDASGGQASAERGR